MLTRNRLPERCPERGSFDYLLTPPRERKEATLLPPPPTPPERGGGNPRVRIEIEIVQRCAQPAPRQTGRWLLAAILWAIVVGLLLSAGHARAAEDWTAYRQGFMTHWQGSDGSSATSYQQGFMTHFDANMADGTTRHCRSWQQSGETFVRCD